MWLSDKATSRARPRERSEAVALGHILLGAALALGLSLTGCYRASAEAGTTTLTAERHEGLRIGYTLLADTLADESKLGTLDIAKDFGKAEMLSRKGGFDVRFVLVQAQATRMIAAMAKATARFDPNPERKAWLKELAAEYECYRADLIKYLGGREASK